LYTVHAVAMARGIMLILNCKIMYTTMTMHI
jgi:hypothetical protein